MTQQIDQPAGNVDAKQGPASGSSSDCRTLPALPWSNQSITAQAGIWLVVGNRNSGKTTAVKDLIRHLDQDYRMPAVVVCHGHEDVVREYQRHVPRPLIHDDLTTDLFQHIAQRQELIVHEDTMATSQSLAQLVLAVLPVGPVSRLVHRYAYAACDPRLLVVVDDAPVLSTGSRSDCRRLWDQRCVRDTLYHARRLRLTFILAVQDDIGLPRWLLDLAHLVFVASERMESLSGRRQQYDRLFASVAVCERYADWACLWRAIPDYDWLVVHPGSTPQLFWFRARAGSGAAWWFAGTGCPGSMTSGPHRVCSDETDWSEWD